MQCQYTTSTSSFKYVLHVGHNQHPSLGSWEHHLQVVVCFVLSVMLFTWQRWWHSGDLSSSVKLSAPRTIPTVAETNTGHFGSRDGEDLRAFSSKCPKEMFYNQRGDLIAKQFGLEGPTLIVGHGPGDYPGIGPRKLHWRIFIFVIILMFQHTVPALSITSRDGG